MLAAMTTPSTDLSTLEVLCQAEALAGPGDAAHDPSHLLRVIATARRLAAVEGARPDVVIPAAWLHDCVVVPKMVRPLSL